MLPNVSNFSPKHSDKLLERHDAQLQQDTHGHNMEELPVGSTVGYCDHTTNQFHIGIVLEREGSVRFGIRMRRLIIYCFGRIVDLVVLLIYYSAPSTPQGLLAGSKREHPFHLLGIHTQQSLTN